MERARCQGRQRSQLRLARVSHVKGSQRSLRRLSGSGRINAGGRRGGGTARWRGESCWRTSKSKHGDRGGRGHGGTTRLLAAERVHHGRVGGAESLCVLGQAQNFRIRPSQRRTPPVVVASAETPTTAVPPDARQTADSPACIPSGYFYVPICLHAYMPTCLHAYSLYQAAARFS